MALQLVLACISCVAQPEETSGEDRHRHQAAEIPLAQPVPDEFSWPSGDRTDWKRFVVPEDGLLTVNVHFVNVRAAARVGLFDTYGKLVAKRIKESGRDEHLQFSERVAGGRYFLRVMADDEGDASEYTVIVQLD